MELTYHEYLRLGTLLDLQEPRSSPEEHDEMLFIVIHQVYELWFKEMLHELEKVCRDFSAANVFGSLGTLKRVRMILKTAVGQLDILETMTPMSFVAFRERLETASGFQSYQFRELEFLLGHKRNDVVQSFPAGSVGRRRLEQRIAARSLVDHLYDLLEQRGLAIPAELRAKDPTRPNEANAEIQAGLLRMYRNEPDLALLFEQLTDIDEGLQEWRYRHVKIVERTIGNKRGTGGSPGVEFLRRTLFQPIFPDLWAIRHEL
jgi:tryptophan 2,3-dioxygenase